MDIHRRVIEFLDAGRRFCVGVVLSAEGHTPQKVGVKALIDDAGRIWGTLGGGAVEAEAQRPDEIISEFPAAHYGVQHAVLKQEFRALEPLG